MNCMLQIYGKPLSRDVVILNSVTDLTEPKLFTQAQDQDHYDQPRYCQAFRGVLTSIPNIPVSKDQYPNISISKDQYPNIPFSKDQYQYPTFKHLNPPVRQFLYDQYPSFLIDIPIPQFQRGNIPEQMTNILDWANMALLIKNK